MLALAACGSKKESAAGGSNLSAYDFRFEPTTLSVKKGESVTLHFKNEGTVEHNFSVTGLSVDQDAAKGETKTVTFTAPAGVGDVQFFCKYHKDSKNMVATLHVT